MQERTIYIAAPRHTSPLGRALGLMLSIGLMIMAAMFSLVALAVVAVGGVVAGSWLWWKTRKLRRELGKMAQTPGTPQQSAPAQDAAIIDGEWVREEEKQPIPSATTMR